MVSLLKTFGKGILYVLGLPFFILALLLFGVLGVFAFLFQALKSIIFFFTGHKFFPELPEDKEVRLLKEKELREKEPELEYEKKDILMPFEDIDEPIPEPEQAMDQEQIIEDEKRPNEIEEVCFKPSYDDEDEKPQDTIEEDVHEASLNDLLDDDEVEEEIIEEDINKNILMDDEEHTILETAEEKESEEDLVEELETYVPRSSNYEGDIDEEDAEDIGVDIDYDVR